MANLTDSLVNGSLRVTGKIYGNVPTAPAGTSTEQIASTAFVTTAIDNLPEPMIFKGSLGTGGTITALPAAAKANEGFTYKVITAGTYASKAAKVGDTFISTGSAWELIPSGDEPSGTVTSVGLTGDGPITVTGSPVTSSGTLALSFGTTAIGNGGTGATTQQAAQYNIIKPQAATADLDNNKRFTFISENPSNTTQLIYYRTGSTVWSWIKGKLSSDTGVNISGSAASCTGNAATASAAKSGSALETAINGKVSANTAITSATKCKITYDTKGLVTAGADLAAGDIPNLAASKITSGTFDVARIPDLSAAKITSGNLDVNRLEKYSIAYHRIPSRDSTKDGKQWTRIAYKTISTYPTKSNWGAADAVLDFYQNSYSGTSLCNIGRLSIESHWGHNDVAEGGTPYSFKTSGTKAARWNNYNPTTISSVNYGTDNDGHIVVKVVCTDDTIEWWLANCIWDTGVTYFVRFKSNLNLYGDTTSGASIKTNDEFNEYIKDKAVTNMTFGDGSVAYAANNLEPTSNYGRYKELTFTGVTWATFISAASVANSFAYKLFGSTFDDTERTVRCLGRLNISDSGNTIASTLGMGGYPQYEVYATRQVGYVKFSGSGKMAWYQFNRYGAIGSKITISGTAEGVAWSGVTGTPTTVAGYGITDAITDVSGKLDKTGGDMTGNITMSTASAAYNSVGLKWSTGSFIGTDNTNGLGLYATKLYLRPGSAQGTSSGKGLVISETDLTYNGGGFEIQGTSSVSSYANGGGAFHNGYANLLLRGNATTGVSGIVFTSSKGTTSVNQPSDKAFIQYHPMGVTTLSAEGNNPTLGTSGEANKLVIGVGNDSDDMVYIQAPAKTGIRHIAGTTNSIMLDSANYYGYVDTRILGQCDTAAATAAKTVTLPGYSLRKGSVIRIKVNIANTAASALSLNVNPGLTGNAAKTIKILTSNNTWTTTSATVYTLAAGNYDCYYDGTNWLMMPTSSNVATISSNIAVLADQATYATKNVFAEGFRLASGESFKLYVDTDNTSATALKLNVNNTGEKPLYINNAATSTSSYTFNSNWYTVYYDGTNYYANSSTNAIPIAATNVNLTGSVKTTSAADGDTIQFQAGTGTAGIVTIVNAKHAASADNCTYATELNHGNSGRLASLDFEHVNSGAGNTTFRIDPSTSTNTVHKPGCDGFVMTYNWDNNGKYDTQLLIPDGSTANNGIPKIRFRDNGSWGDWDNLKAGYAVKDGSGNVITDTYQAKLTFDGTYSSSTNAVATVSTVTNAINALDVTAKTGTTTQTITSISETDGKVSVTYSDIATMGAATASAAGTKGLVPAPGSGKQNSFLRGDGTWAVPADTLVKQSVTTTSNYRPIILGYQNDTTHTTLSNDITQQVYATNTMYAQPSTGMIAATSYKVAEKATMQFNTTDNCVEFVF